MTDISRHPLLQQAYDVCQAIEQCGASVQLTHAVCKASDLLRAIDEHLHPRQTADEIEYFSQAHVHTSGDGRGLRRILVDGAEVRDASFADTKLGIVVAADQPVRVLEGTGRIVERVLMGYVCVEPVTS
ncbi:hypothetical protein ACIPL1_30590 [Pseudomonas sp. NPDC090202]|uniref:hypothetical protein n=1 Tax=Pseudomonas sp. NPDC090202 TaxID=3364476 RepID=UPI003827391A